MGRKKNLFTRHGPHCSWDKLLHFSKYPFLPVFCVCRPCSSGEDCSTSFWVGRSAGCPGEWKQQPEFSEPPLGIEGAADQQGPATQGRITTQDYVNIPSLYFSFPASWRDYAKGLYSIYVRGSRQIYQADKAMKFSYRQGPQRFFFLHCRRAVSSVNATKRRIKGKEDIVFCNELEEIDCRTALSNKLTIIGGTYTS